MPSEIIKRCSAAIAAKGWNIAFVESATAGRMCSEFALTEESGKILRGGISCYEVFVKEQILNVPHKLIEDHTPESAEVTAALAKQAARLFNSKVTVAVTGLTTAGGSETSEKPVGTMFLSIVTPTGTINDRTVYKGAPEEMILQVTDRAAGLLYEHCKR
ncbi:CinA family protein [Flavobacterium sp.]|uniref:CinA family protein n=1 Tax=Flavobacterium sp. TaxID=239 RepID=UPI004034070A